MDKRVQSTQSYSGLNIRSEILEELLLEGEFEREIDLLRAECLQPRPEAVLLLLAMLPDRAPLAAHS